MGTQWVRPRESGVKLELGENPSLDFRPHLEWTGQRLKWMEKAKLGSERV